MSVRDITEWMMQRPNETSETSIKSLQRQNCMSPKASQYVLPDCRISHKIICIYVYIILVAKCKDCQLKFVLNIIAKTC